MHVSLRVPRIAGRSNLIGIWATKRRLLRRPAGLLAMTISPSQLNGYPSGFFSALLVSSIFFGAGDRARPVGKAVQWGFGMHTESIFII